MVFQVCERAKRGTRMRELIGVDPVEKRVGVMPIFIKSITDPKDVQIVLFGKVVS